MFFIGTTPTIYQVQYVSGTFALAVDKYEFADKDEIPDISNLATKSEVNAKQDALVSGTNIKTLNGESLLGEGNIQLDEGPIDYETLTNKPSINSVELSGNLSFEDLGLDVNPTWEQIQNKPTFATVATSGDYDDLTDTPDLTVYQPITDNSLATSAKTIPAAINEIKESVDSISDPYEINLTNLLSAEDSESISTAIGGIDNLNATVQNNRIIVGTISNGNVSVSIRILGNVTTLYYLLDSVVGLTLNEVAITNTSGTLSKSVTTHSVLTENMVINSLESDETTLPLSAAQGKALNSKIDSIDVSASITNAINALDSSGQTVSTGEVISSVSQENGVISVSKKTLTSDDIPELPQSKITDLENTLAGKQDAGDYATNSALTDGLAAKQDTLISGTGIEITPENQINVTLDTTVFKVVSVLPDSPTQGDENKIHLVPAESTGANNAYTEYVWVNSTWEILGEYTSEVDLTPYLKSTDAANTYLSKTDAASTYATAADFIAHTGKTSNPHNVTAAQVGLGNVNNTSDEDKPVSTAQQTALDLKQNITDNSLPTTSKTITGAITEIYNKQTVYTEVPTLTADYNIPANDTFVEHTYIINIGDTVYNVTGDSAIRWAGAVTPVASANAVLVVSVVKNLATWNVFMTV